MEFRLSSRRSDVIVGPELRRLFRRGASGERESEEGQHHKCGDAGNGLVTHGEMALKLSTGRFLQ